MYRHRHALRPALLPPLCHCYCPLNLHVSMCESLHKCALSASIRPELCCTIDTSLLAFRASMDLAADDFEIEVLAVGSTTMLCRPCVDCGRYTGRFCDHCFAKDRVPSEEWAANQRTPLCSKCDWRWNACRFCRRVHACTPFAHGTRAME